LFTNGVALTVHTVINLDGGVFGTGILGILVSLYALIGFCAGSVGIITYWGQESIPEIYYDLNHFAYRTVTVAAVILVTGVFQHVL